MTGYLRRNDIGDPPNKANLRGAYQIKYFSNADPLLLEDEINAFLADLPALIGPQWTPHVVDMHFSHDNVSGAPPADLHQCWITLYAVGIAGNAFTP